MIKIKLVTDEDNSYTTIPVKVSDTAALQLIGDSIVNTSNLNRIELLDANDEIIRIILIIEVDKVSTEKNGRTNSESSNPSEKA